MEYTRWSHRLGFLLRNTLDTNSKMLSENGIVLLERLRETHETTLLDNRIQAPPAIKEIAEILDLDHKISWRLRNLAPGSSFIADLTKRWKDKKSCTDVDYVVVEVIPGKRKVVRGYNRAQALTTQITGTGLPAEDMTKSERQLAAKEYDSAYELYKKDIINDPTDAEPWAGLALLEQQGRTTGAQRALLLFPEVVHELHKSIYGRYNIAADPKETATWLGSLPKPIIMRY
jgi:hypothetical protein